MSESVIRRTEGLWGRMPCDRGFMGLVVYADDILLLAPNRKTAQNMLSNCDRYIIENDIRFSTDPNPAKS